MIPASGARSPELPAVNDAIEWLEANQDKSIEEIRAESTKSPESEEGPQLKEGEEARSLVCNECGKKFRSHAQAEFHASKTQHVDFSESTEEIAPLTEEQKKQKLQELREKLAAKRAAQAEQDKIDQKRNEVGTFLCREYTAISLADQWGRKSGARAPRNPSISEKSFRGKNK